MFPGMPWIPWIPVADDAIVIVLPAGVRVTFAPAANVTVCVSPLTESTPVFDICVVVVFGCARPIPDPVVRDNEPV